MTRNLRALLLVLAIALSTVFSPVTSMAAVRTCTVYYVLVPLSENPLHVLGGAYIYVELYRECN